MRALVFFLVFANLAAFVLSGGVSGRTALPEADDGRAHAQLSPDRIRIVSRGVAPPVSTPPQPACLAWLDLPADMADRLQAAVEAEGTLKFRRDEMTVRRKSYWIHIPSNGNGKAGAERKIAELRQLGVNDYFLIGEPGIDQWAISLGLFSSEALASAALTTLRQKGVRSARLATRERTGVRPVWRVQGPAQELEPLRTLFAEPPPLACAELAAAAPADVGEALPAAAASAASPTPAANGEAQ